VTEPGAQAVHLVESCEALGRAVAAWGTAPALALDTEFVRERTFYQRLGLVQVGDGRAAYLIDPLSAGDLAPLRAPLGSPGAVKVVHSGSEDIEVFHRYLGILPQPLFDTQIAAALAGHGYSLSYQRLVALLLGLELPKGETRTDWMARPLSCEQLHYAAEDVVHLLPVYERLRSDLESLGRLAWAFEESAELLDPVRFEEKPDTAFLRVKGAGRLRRRQLAALQRLAAWREQEARRRDLPRSFVLKEEVMLEIATRLPQTAQEFAKLSSCVPRQTVRDGETWLAFVQQALEIPEAELPREVERMPYSPAVKVLEQKLRERSAAKAAELGLPVEILAPRRLLASLLRLAVSGGPGETGPRLPRELSGWRREVIGEDLLAEVMAAGRLVE
jgi:ribonuclease D